MDQSTKRVWPICLGWTGARDGGAGGIRTLDRALQPYNGLANRRLQPLGHSSIKADMPDAGARRKRQMAARRNPYKLIARHASQSGRNSAALSPEMVAAHRLASRLSSPRDAARVVLALAGNGSIFERVPRIVAALDRK